MVFAQAKPLVPALVLLSFGGGDTGAGILLSAGALGVFLGVTFSGWLKNIERQGRLLTLSYIGWGAGFMGFCALAFAGWCDALGGIYRSTIIQTASPDNMRGRLQGLFIVTVTGGPNLGTALVGGSAALVGSPLAAILGGALCICAIAGVSFKVPALWQYRPTPLEDTRAITQVAPNS